MKLKINKPFIIFDIESTGVNVGKDKIIEIYMLKISPDGSEKEFYKKLNPGIPIPPESIVFHGITDEDVKDAPLFKDIAGDLLQFIGNADLGGYNSNKFDVPILVEEFLRDGFEFDITKRRFVDVMGIFHKMEPRNLKAAYKFYCNKDLIDAHTAAADARATWEILEKQLEFYEDKEIDDENGKKIKPVSNNIEQLSTFSKLNNNADLVGHLVYNENGEEVFNFGKYKGITVEEVFRREPQYYDWIMKSQFPESTKKLVSAIKLRNLSNASLFNSLSQKK